MYRFFMEFLKLDIMFYVFIENSLQPLKLLFGLRAKGQPSQARVPPSN